MILTYYGTWIITAYSSYFAFILGIVTVGAGALITFILTKKLITKTSFNRWHVFLIGGLSFFVTDIVLWCFNALIDKSPVAYILDLDSSNNAIYGEVIFFWQLFVGVKLVFMLRIPFIKNDGTSLTQNHNISP